MDLNIAVQLYMDGQPLGVLRADAERLEAFRQYELRLLDTGAGWVGTLTYRPDIADSFQPGSYQEGELSPAEQLVTIIAHDLRNYLTPLLGRIGYIGRQAAQDCLVYYVENAQEMATVLRRMNRMVGDLLDVAKLEQGLFAVTPQNVDLTGLARETASALSTPYCPISVEFADPVRTEVDPDRMRQALENLLVNAINHSPEGAFVRVFLATGKQDGSERAFITVQDDGPGIDHEMMPRLFTRFAPGPGSTGLGLGLYLARGIAQAHGGNLTVESAPGRGATFRMALPLVAAVPAADTRPSVATLLAVRE